MQTKAAFASTWLQYDPDTLEKELAYRIRVGSEDKLLPQRKEPITEVSSARFLVLVGASDTHLDAVVAAKRVLGLRAFARPGESGHLFKRWCHNRTLEEALSNIFRHINNFPDWNELGAAAYVQIEHLAIASNFPHAELRLRGFRGHDKPFHETIRFGEGQIGAYDQMISHLKVNYFSGELVGAIARLARTDTLKSDGKNDANSPSEG
jgi:hypothetical protein